MTGTLSPKACAPDAWKTWLKDGGRLALRSASGWGLVWLAVFFAWGALTDRMAWVGMILATLTGAVELGHAAVMATVRDGQVGLGASLKAVGAIWRQQGTLLRQSLIARFKGGLVALVCCGLLLLAVHALMQALRHGAAAPVAEPDPFWWTWANRSGSFVYLALMLRRGSVISMVLPLMRDHGMSGAQAMQLQLGAVAKNPALETRLFQYGRLALILALIFAPVLIPVLELWIAGTLACVYADVFGDGYQVKALARWRVPGLATPVARGA